MLNVNGNGKCLNPADSIAGFFSQHYCFKHYFQVFFILELFSAGEIKGLAFIKDPDGYWIEIFDRKTIGNVTQTAA